MTEGLQEHCLCFSDDRCYLYGREWQTLVLFMMKCGISYKSLLPVLAAMAPGQGVGEASIAGCELACPVWTDGLHLGRDEEPLIIGELGPASEIGGCETHFLSTYLYLRRGPAQPNPGYGEWVPGLGFLHLPPWGARVPSLSLHLGV